MGRHPETGPVLAFVESWRDFDYGIRDAAGDGEPEIRDCVRARTTGRDSGRRLEIRESGVRPVVELVHVRKSVAVFVLHGVLRVEGIEAGGDFPPVGHCVAVGVCRRDAGAGNERFECVWQSVPVGVRPGAEPEECRRRIRRTRMVAGPDDVRVDGFPVEGRNHEVRCGDARFGMDRSDGRVRGGRPFKGKNGGGVRRGKGLHEAPDDGLERIRFVEIQNAVRRRIGRRPFGGKTERGFVLE